MFGQEETQSPTQEKTTKINPEILSSLGLSEEDVAEYDRERLNELKILQTMTQQGLEDYNSAGRTGAFIITLKLIPERLTIAGTFTRSQDVPDGIMAEFVKIKVLRENISLKQS